MPKLCFRRDSVSVPFSCPSRRRSCPGSARARLRSPRPRRSSGVAGQRREILDQRLHIVVHVRTVGMAGHLRLLPGREARIDVLQRLIGLRLQPLHVFADGVGVAVAGELLSSSIFASSSATGFSKSRYARMAAALEQNPAGRKPSAAAPSTAPRRSVVETRRILCDEGARNPPRWSSPWTACAPSSRTRSPNGSSSP